MDHNLSEAAEQGNVNVLYAAISSDPFILHNLDKIPFFNTPLHIAALVGQTDFALEIMMLMPSLGRKLNQNGYSPIHLAAINGHEKLVRGLLAIDKDLVRVKGKEGKTPLHCISILEGYTSLLGEMISACPDSIEDLTLKRETALHLAVRNNQQTLSFKILVEAVKKFHKEEIYRWQDEDGNTVLHRAIISIQLEMIQLLFEKYKFKEWKLGVDVKDHNGHTAVDILDNFLATHVRRDSMRDILSLGTLQGIVTPRVNEGMWICNRCWGYIMDQVSLAVQKVPRDSRDALLVVLALVNTTSFQAGVNPPGGFWQGDDDTSDGKKYAAGTPILATTSPAFYFAISLFNMAGFISSFNLIVVLTVGMPMKYLLIFAMIFLSYSYLFAFTAITREHYWIVHTNYGIVTLFFAIIIVMCVRKHIKRYYQRGRGDQSED